jgi:aminoglycoside phosphotransferase (APT) family kinase protein
VTDELFDIPGYANWEIVKKIEAGWSNDKKYFIIDRSGNLLLLRTSDISLAEAKKKEFQMIKRCNSLHFEMSKAIVFGYCNNQKNVFMLLSWVEGIALSKILDHYPENEQYELGLKAGKILKEIHSMPVDGSDLSGIDIKEKIYQKLERYENSNVRLENDQFAIDYVRNNIYKINPLPPVYQHGDFHVGNLLLTPDKQVGVIDFNRWDCGDRYEEFYKLQSFDVEISIPFSIGQIDAYFERQPPEEFWEALAVYVAYTGLYSILWAEQFGESEKNGMRKRCLDSFDDYDKFNTVIPRWYTDNFMKFRK